MNKKHIRNLFAFTLISFFSLSAMELDEGGRGKRSLETMDLEEGYKKKSTDEFTSPTGPIVCFNGEEIPVSDLNLWDLQLVFAGARNVNSPFQNGLTPLMLACLHGDPVFVAALLENFNADANRVDQAKNTALMHAAGSKKPFTCDIVRQLLAKNADPTRSDRFGNTALSIAENTARWVNPEDLYDKSQEVVTLLKEVTSTLQQP